MNDKAELIEILEGVLEELKDDAEAIFGEYCSDPTGSFAKALELGEYPFAERAIELLKKLKGEI